MRPIPIQDLEGDGCAELLETVAFTTAPVKLKRAEGVEFRPEIASNGGAFVSFWRPSLWERTKVLFGADVRVMVGYSWGPLRVDTVPGSEDGSPLDW